jgi:predicted neutral ceramidase superfamily lipid hydrolase
MSDQKFYFCWASVFWTALLVLIILVSYEKDNASVLLIAYPVILTTLFYAVDASIKLLKNLENT